MTYNWEKIFRNKSGEELYKIYLGKSHLNEDAIDFAKKELENRNVDFENIERHKKKWELERLINENDEGSLFQGSISSSKHFFLMGVLGGVISVISLFDIFLDYTAINDPIEANKLKEISLFAFSLVFMAFGFIMHKKEKKRELIRNKRITEIINEL